jgi:kynurenine 3-monooxygenase
VVGAGLAGTLMAIFLARRGYAVHVFERRPDIRVVDAERGRSINLALSHRGIRALEAAGVKDSVADVERIGIKMYGRMIHHSDGSTAFQRYGKDDECLYSVSRTGLNAALLHYLEEQPNVCLSFGERCVNVNFETATASFEAVSFGSLTPSPRPLGAIMDVDADRLIGADGAFSGVRFKMQRLDRFNYEQSYLDHGYKELTIPAGSDGRWQIDPHALHIWPRGRFMLIALPNSDGSFTCTLFLPFESVSSLSTVPGSTEPAFSHLTTPEAVRALFAEHFADALTLMPRLQEEFFDNPTASLVTIRCAPWVVGSRVALIGDAAHAIVPFYGQGINAGFEDCRIFDELLDEFHDDWSCVLPAYYRQRKPNGDAIAELAYRNFIEMSERVADARFLLRKAIERRLHERHPEVFLPVYSMVTFSHLPYADALQEQVRQDALFEQVMALPALEECWATPEYDAIIDAILWQFYPR